MIYLVTKNDNLVSNNTYKVITVEESLSLLEPLRVVGLDTETSGLDPYTKELLSLQLGCYEFQVVIDCTTIDILLYKEYLESDRLFLGWNLKFDIKWLFKYGIILNKVYDGFLSEKLLWLGYPSGLHSMSLKAAGQNYLGIELDKSIRGKIIWNGLNSEDTVKYAALDVKYLGKIKDCQIKELEKKGLLIALEYENRFVLPLAYCEYCGVKLHIERWKAKMQKDKEREKLAKEALNKWLLDINENGFKDIDRQIYINPHSFDKYISINRWGNLFTGYDLTPKVIINWNSAKQVIPIFKLFNVNTEIEDKENGGTKDSIDAKTLKPQKDKCSLIPLYLEYKEAVKVTSTYGENFLEQINPISGRIHTNFQQLGADTTRITSGGTDKQNKTEYLNLLNLPADAETRKCFIAEDGNKWISIDYSG